MSLKGNKQIEDLRDLIEDIHEEGIRSKLQQQLANLESESERWRKQSEELDKAQLLSQDTMQVEINKVKIFQMRSQIWLSIFEKESIASIVGSVLLVVIAVALLIAMFRNTPTSEIVNNTFLVLLGYFFGQTVSKNLPKSKDNV